MGPACLSILSAHGLQTPPNPQPQADVCHHGRPLRHRQLHDAAPAPEERRYAPHVGLGCAKHARDAGCLLPYLLLGCKSPSKQLHHNAAYQCALLALSASTAWNGAASGCATGLALGWKQGPLSALQVGWVSARCIVAHLSSSVSSTLEVWTCCSCWPPTAASA